MKKIEELEKLFNLTPSEKTEEPKLPAIISNKVDDTEDDYQLARRTLRNLIYKGDSTLDEMINLAKNSEHPRTYEVAGQLIKTMSDVAKDLIGLQKQVRELDGTSADNAGHIGTQNNIVFAGTTSDLLKLLKKDDKTIDSE
jgi:hypothetical protein